MLFKEETLIFSVIYQSVIQLTSTWKLAQFCLINFVLFNEPLPEAVLILIMCDSFTKTTEAIVLYHKSNPPNLEFYES